MSPLGARSDILLLSSAVRFFRQLPVTFDTGKKEKKIAICDDVTSGQGLRQRKAGCYCVVANGVFKGAVSRSEHLEKTSRFFQFCWSAIRVNRPHALPSMFDFDFVGLGCGILTHSVIIFNFSLV